MSNNVSVTIITSLTCVYYVIYIIILTNCLVAGKKNLGDICKSAGTDGPGICTDISDCPKVHNDIRNNLGFPVICGYENQVEIVCCPNDLNVISVQSRPEPTIFATDKPLAKPRISEQKCDEYKKYAYEYVESYSKVKNQNSSRLILSCPLESVVLSLNDEPAVLKEFPHMAIIGYVTSKNIIHWRCSGILISDEYVITAGHCATHDAHFVKLGDLILNDETDGAQPIQIRILEKITHPKYRKLVKYNDIALLQLAEKVSFTSFIRPACLPTRYTVDTEKRLIVTGWVGDSLHRGILEIVQHSQCNSMYKFVGGALDRTQFCAEPQTYDGNACQSMSDGVLQIHHSDSCMYTVIGVPIQIQLCGIRTYTGVFPYLDWIEGIVWPNA